MITSTRKVIQIKFLFILFFQGEGEWVGAGGGRKYAHKRYGLVILSCDFARNN